MTDTRGTCLFYVSIDQPECGAEADESVPVNITAGKVSIPLCTKHLAAHRKANDESARRRLDRAQRRDVKAGINSDNEVDYLVQGGVTKL